MPRRKQLVGHCAICGDPCYSRCLSGRKLYCDQMCVNVAYHLRKVDRHKVLQGEWAGWTVEQKILYRAFHWRVAAKQKLDLMDLRREWAALQTMASVRHHVFKPKTIETLHRLIGWTESDEENRIIDAEFQAGPLLQAV